MTSAIEDDINFNKVSVCKPTDSRMCVLADNYRYADESVQSLMSKIEKLEQDLHKAIDRRDKCLWEFVFADIFRRNTSEDDLSWHNIEDIMSRMQTTVYVFGKGTKYHMNDYCGSGYSFSRKEFTLVEALVKQYEPCSRCALTL